MEGAVLIGDGYALGPRVPLLRNREEMEPPTHVLGPRVLSRVMPRASSTTSADPCATDSSSNLCEKPAAAKSMTLPIALGIAIPVVLALGVLLYLHRRSVLRQRREDARDPHKSLDFGLDVPGTGKAGKANRRSMLGGREKDAHGRFKSMDMNLESPYLLPPTLQGSRESMNSLARTLHQNEDPYRPVTQYTAEQASLRSASRGPPDAASLYTAGSGEKESAHPPKSLNGAGAYIAPPRRTSMLKSPPAPEAAYMKPQPAIPEDLSHSPAPSSRDPFRSPSERSVASSPYPDEPTFAAMPKAPEIQEPPNAAHRVPDKPMPQGPQPGSGNESGYDIVQQYHHEDRHRSQQAVIHERGLSAVSTATYDHIQARSPPQQPAALAMSPPPAVNSQLASPQPQRAAEQSGALPILEEPQDYYDDYANMPEDGYEHGGYQEHEERGRNMYRESQYYPQDQQGQTGLGLGVPQQDNRRLSVGFRPLPPDELMDTEDPETRANRIRSFYKEYFDDSKPQEPLPPVPQGNWQQQHQQQQGQYPQGGVDYYEDYDQHYHQAGAQEPYYDPDSNQFVMPYAQPVARRAMTPPPSGSRFGGPRGPPRGIHGSMGGMSMPGGRGPPRSGSPASSRFGPPRAGSSMSGAWGRPRAGSSLSAYGGGRNGPHKKQLPPPSVLNTLPAPSKLRDDSFALMNAMDFAPPETFANRVRGRSQSPMGERRPYQIPNVPAHSPLVGASEELASLPSPHLLRKSSTFTGLDFAPPRKFVETDNRSETGSIRSNRSGISAVHLGAIRSGAGRVSRLPEDSIFTQAQQMQKLKPQWGMRNGDV